MEPINFSIRFPDTTAAEANRLAAELKQVLSETHPDVRVTQARERTDTMDLGPLLEIVLSSAVAVEVAKGLFAWLQKRRNATLEITKDGTLRATGLRVKDVKALTEMILKQKDP